MFFDWLQRKKHAKGHGIHSPFAFHFITQVVYEPHGYNAFFDIEEMLSKNNIDGVCEKLHHLSFRLVRYFQPEKIIEINSGKGINTLYINAAGKNKVCRCLEKDAEKMAVATKLQKQRNGNIEFINETLVNQQYNGIFLYPGNYSVSLEELFSMSQENTFWVIADIYSKNGKQFWKNIVNDKRATFTFDVKDIGIVVLKKTYHKLNYLI